jgi:hypothetical protein
MNLFWSVILLQSFLLLLFNFNQIFAEELSTNDFKLYQNKNHSLELMYPSDWKYVEFKDQFSDNDLFIITSFISPLKSPVDAFQEYFTIKLKILDLEDTFSNHFKSYLEKLNKTMINIKISNIEDTSKINKYIQYSFSPQPGLVIMKDEYIFLKSNNIFHIEFTSDSNDYQTFKLFINKIISYFRIV